MKVENIGTLRIGDAISVRRPVKSYGGATVEMDDEGRVESFQPFSNGVGYYARCSFKSGERAGVNTKNIKRRL